MIKIKFLKEVLSTRTVRQSFITSTATLTNGILGIFFYILLGRFLGPEKFGIFSVVVMTATMLADITNVGTDTGIIKFVSKYRKENLEKALRFIKLGLEIKVLAGLMVFAFGWFLSPSISYLLEKPELAYPLRYAFLGTLGILLFSLTTNAIQAFEKFAVWGVLNICLNAIRLIGIVILFFLGNLNTESSLQIYVLFPFIGFIVGSFFLPNYLKVERGHEVAKEFMHYNKWVALFILIAAISGRLDTYLSAKILTLREVGIYSAAVSLAAVGSQIVAGIATVVAPKLAAFDSKKKVIKYLNKLQVFVVILGLVEIVIGIPLAYLVIPNFFGSEFAQAVKPFIVLLIAQAVFLISIPAHTAVFYYFSKPSLFIWISLVHLLIIGGLGWILISRFGYMGASVTVLVGNLSNFVIPAIWVLSRFKKIKQ